MNTTTLGQVLLHKNLPKIDGASASAVRVSDDGPGAGPGNPGNPGVVELGAKRTAQQFRAGGAADTASSLLPPCNTGVNYLAKLFDVGIDWLTSTCSDGPTVDKLRLISWGFAKELEAGGETLQRQKWLGYTGFQAGSFFFGERDDGVCTRASGVAAEPLFHAIKALDLVRPSRLDLQATMVLPFDTNGYARCLAMAAKQAAVSRLGGRPAKVKLIESFGDGDTVYLGSPKSEVMARSYDKHKESGGKFPVGCWRNEVQYKGSQAQQVYKQLLPAPSLGKMVLGHVARWFEDKGLPMALENVEDVDAIRTVKHETDVETSLRWLRMTVRPSVQGLIARGFQAQVLDALGLPGGEAGPPTALEKLLRQRGVIG
jgi:hypothetical protein